MWRLSWRSSILEASLHDICSNEDREAIFIMLTEMEEAQGHKNGENNKKAHNCAAHENGDQ